MTKKAIIKLIRSGKPFRVRPSYYDPRTVSPYIYIASDWPDSDSDTMYLKCYYQFSSTGNITPHYESTSIWFKGGLRLLLTIGEVKTFARLDTDRVEFIEEPIVIPE